MNPPYSPRRGLCGSPIPTLPLSPTPPALASLPNPTLSPPPIPIQVMIDSGASGNFVDPQLLADNNLLPHPHPMLDPEGN